MNHYYNDNSNLNSDIQEIAYTYRNNKLRFFTDNGVFSKTRVDFGTNVLLKNLEIDDNCSSLLDIGCGYGTIGLCLAKANSGLKITMADINPRATDLTFKNATINRINNVKIYTSDLYENLSENFDMIVSNPPIRAGKQVVHKIVSDGYNKLNEGGSMWIVIQNKQGAPSMKKKLIETFGNTEIIAKEKGYFIFKSVK